MKHHVLDVRNLLCPMPVIRLQNTMTKLTPGDTVEVAHEGGQYRFGTVRPSRRPEGAHA